MTAFNEPAFVKKLTDLNNTSQSIQTVSLWVIHHRKFHETIVKVWLRELQQAKETKKLILMYLANDVIQNSRKKGPEFGKEFGLNLKAAFENIASNGCADKTRNSINRILDIWKQRGVYDELQITAFRQAILFVNEPPFKKQKKTEQQKEKNKSESELTEEVEAKVETQFLLSPRTHSDDPPEPEEIITAIIDLESNTASSDEVVRQQIAQLPMEVSEASYLSKIEDKEAADELSKKVDEALALIADYNNRLSTEVECRKKVSLMLRDFLISQKELLAQAESGLEEYQDKLQKVYLVRQELKSHIQNLPDLTALPDVTGGLAPLPSAGDLFNVTLHNSH